MGIFNLFKKKNQPTAVPKPEPRSSLKGTKLLDSIIIDGEDCEAIYKYNDVRIYKHYCDISQLSLYTRLTLKSEPENEYDPKAVALYDNNRKIGYLLKGKLQEMANDWQKRDEPMRAMISKLEENNICIDLYFYEAPSKHISSWKNKIVTLSGNKLDDFQNNISTLECDAQKLDLEYDYDKGQYLISDGNLDIGYIPKSFEEKPMACYLEKISETANGKYTVKVKVYYK